MRQTGDGIAIQGVKRIDPGLIVEVRGIGIIRGIVAYLTTVLDVLQSGAQVLKELGTRSNQVDGSRGIAEGPRHRVGNVVVVTGLLRGFEDCRAGAIEHAFDLGSLQVLLANRRTLCRRNCD
jgi:hypothetical protein